MHGAIVTGASRGLGAALAAALLAEGAAVVGLARHATPDTQTLAERYPDRWTFIEADLGDTARLAEHCRAALALLDKHHPAALTLINNAGVVTPVAQAGHYPTGEMIAAYAVNLLAPVALTDAFLALTSANVERRVLNISSGAAAKPYPGWGVYGSSKAALDHFTRTVAVEQAAQPNGARLVSLYPGVIDTAMQTAIRATDPADFPNRARFTALKADGALSQPADAARAIAAFLAAPDFGLEPVVDIRARHPSS
ncbi:SDR family NAD(P)-dependent oxidoreductase [Crenobacter cavernae]|uniref:SDR family NAD(P)-dependent oxidoreductase n=1 Tax=Crenobacter cavernae TaxID=2290923 RepID=A0A345Y810_9NEIS|nr:SDR family NAD(P)-dependent oxidoreductase [Crenobacter cavernae]AXK40062.1 SDR family NAD(P)-dependent oxidoreductase [Crenobacter cavernae]